MANVDQQIGNGLWFTAERTAELRPEAVNLKPEREEICVSAICSLISSGTEMIAYRGEIPVTTAMLPGSRGRFPFPIKYGYQVVGEVLAAGDASGYHPGERVFVAHPHQDVFTVHKGLAHRIPESLSSEKAAFANLFNVALSASLDAPLRLGDVVVVSGAGVVGTLAAAISRRTAGTVVLVEPSERAQVSRTVCNPDYVVTPESATALIHEVSGGRMADVWIEASGAGAALQSALRGTGREGHIVVLSYYGNRTVPLTLSPEFLSRRQRITGSFVSYTGSGLQPRWDTERRMDVTFRALEQTDVERLVSHRRRFDDAPECYRLIDEPTESTFAVLLDYRGTAQSP